MDKRKITYTLGLTVLSLSVPFPGLAANGASMTPSLQNIKVLYDHSQFQQVIDLGQKYIARSPKDNDAKVWIAYAYFQLKNYNRAAAMFSQILQSEPSFLEIRFALIQSYMAAHDYKGAMSAVNNGLVYAPNNIDLLFKRSEIFSAQHDYAHSISASRDLLVKHPNYKPALKLIKNAEVAMSNTPSPGNATTKTIAAEKNILPAGTPKTGKEAVIQYDEMHALYKQKRLKEVEAAAIYYLRYYPKDTDVISLLGQVYQDTKRYEEANQKFEQAYRMNHKDSDIRLQLLDNLEVLKRYDEALGIVLEGLEQEPHNRDYLYNKAVIVYGQHKPSVAIEAIKSINDWPNYEAGIEFLKELNHDTLYRYVTHNEMGISNTYTPVRINNAPNQMWNESTVFFSHNTPDGNIGGAYRHQTRPGITANQYEIFAQPIFNDYVYMDTAFDYSNQPIVYPNQMYYAELYVTTPTNITMSAGDRYRRIESNYLNAYTGSISKLFYDHWDLGYRPTYFIPKTNKPRSFLNDAHIRYYGDDMDLYFGFNYAWGTSPDLNDLLSIDFIRLKEHLYLFGGQYPFNDRWAVQYGIGRENDVYPDTTVRRYTYLTFGIRFRDV